ncbi:U2 small nuclear ribonucleoprotein A' [Myotis brandtii]|uniref:U2 small nuclear ribonucleoprotein A n=1 Tax=Myotis brandtii TaxID=109478 RepID=S7N1G8_MYOBR|nr:U2 small nuclear ribonucleoprotein A' [Myotis brandtii]
MVKLTAELIEQAAQYTNAVGDLELDLRGYKIPIIENLGATLDQFDAIDFSDNEIRKLDGFPLLRRLKTLLVNNNRICRIGEALDQALDQALPCLTELVLTNNSLVELRNLDPLASLKSLTYLSILRNPVTNKKHYRPEGPSRRLRARPARGTGTRIAARPVSVGLCSVRPRGTVSQSHLLERERLVLRKHVKVIASE